ncbi:AAA family ATPase [Rubrivirga sp. S365]|uniref:AAA family ATPase n=1 Tax=Rubrivirga litoralis TaxID=3075598 RepID=A0ABU3BSQ0_9BACT|nr:MULTISPECIES: AAA family ATPase [unclassified Rubrivirga]MDT0632312.1 AAA family ATPase [Rubrivirga sp. F394]MDT7856303.1 AAA family ATPase [Rubrivirga sp. S365]
MTDPSPVAPPRPAPEADAPDLGALTEQVAEASRFVGPLLDAVGRVVVGQAQMVERLVIGLLTGGHVLLEGVPGLAKTLTVSTLAQAIDARFQRVQFTPDLLPADLVGTLVYNQAESSFRVQKGPIFANVVLADEVNRAPAKVQSALLEAMQERQVTIGETTYPLPRPFLVLATQNPVEQEGTYPLPEAQVDRFMLKTVVGYPTRDEELEIMRRMSRGAPLEPAAPVVTPDQILDARRVVGGVYVDARVEEYVVDLVLATREPARYGLPDVEGLVAYGASPRASIALALAARAHAFLAGRAYVTPDDVRALALDVLRHRVAVTYEAEAEEVASDAVVRRVLDAVDVP